MQLKRMKKTLFVFGILILFNACKLDQDDRYKTASTEIDLLKKGLTDYENGNWGEWSKQYTDTAIIFHNTWIDTSSVEEVKVRHQNLIAQLSSYTFSDNDRYYEQIIDDKGKTWVNFWGVWKGTLKANSQEIIIPVHLTIQFKEGKVVEEIGYWNTAKLNDELKKIDIATNNN